LAILACFAVGAGFFGTPAWPWFQAWLNGGRAGFNLAKIVAPHQLPVLLLSTGLVFAAIVLSGWIYLKAAARTSRETDPLEMAQPAVFACLNRKFFIDEFYDATVVRLCAAFASFSDWLDRAVLGGLIRAFSWVVLALARLDRAVDESVINDGFDAGTETVRGSGEWMSRFQNGQVQRYLRVIGVAFCVLLVLLLWGSQ
jgi:NADH-quinone oxidoreductase subunit L